MFSAYGTVEGRRHDLPLLCMSGLKDVISAFMNIFINKKGRQFHINGDFPYILRPYLQRSLPEYVARSSQHAFNSIMSAP